jgi:hypothetical protein
MTGTSPPPGRFRTRSRTFRRPHSRKMNTSSFHISMTSGPHLTPGLPVVRGSLGSRQGVEKQGPRDHALAPVIRLKAEEHHRSLPHPSLHHRSLSRKVLGT